MKNDFFVDELSNTELLDRSFGSFDTDFLEQSNSESTDVSAKGQENVYTESNTELLDRLFGVFDTDFPEQSNSESTDVSAKGQENVSTESNTELLDRLFGVFDTAFLEQSGIESAKKPVKGQENAENQLKKKMAMNVLPSASGIKADFKALDLTTRFLDKHKVFSYAKNIYVLDEESYTYKISSNETIKKMMVEDNLSYHEFREISVSFLEEAAKKLRYVADTISSLPKTGFYVNSLSGILNASSLEFEEFNESEHVFLFRVNAHVDCEDVETPYFDTFLEDISMGDISIKKLIMQLIGYMCLSTNPAKVFFVLGCAPNSGKSLLINFIMKVIFGEENVSGVQLHNMGEKFALQDIIGSSLNVQNELPNKPLDQNAVMRIKELTGGDRVNTSVKYGEDMNIYPTCKHIFATNNPLWSKYFDKALYDRMCIVPMEYSIPKENMNLNLLDDLTGERDGIISKAVQYLPELIKNNFIFEESEIARQMKESWKSIVENDTQEECLGKVEYFITEACVLDVDEFTPSLELYKAFVQLYRNVSEDHFYKTVFSLQEKYGFKYKRKRCNGSPHPMRGFVGIAIKEEYNN